MIFLVTLLIYQHKVELKIIYVHARHAILIGCNPKKNRTIPPLKYEFVEKIKKDFPNLQFIINGGINSLNQANEFCKKYDGVMVGRLIQSNPFCLLNVDKIFFGKKTHQQKYQNIILEYFKYVKQKNGTDSIFRLLSPLLCIFFGVPNSKKLKIDIHKNIVNSELDKIETMLLKFAG